MLPFETIRSFYKLVAVFYATAIAAVGLPRVSAVVGPHPALKEWAEVFGNFFGGTSGITALILAIPVFWKMYLDVRKWLQERRKNNNSNKE